MTKDNFLNLDPQIYNNRLAWIRSNAESNYAQDEVFVNNKAIKIDKFTKINNLKISEKNIVWSGFDGKDLEIFLYDGKIRQITNNDTPDVNPQISGNNIVWQGGVANSQEIFFYDGRNVKQITDNDINDINPQISGDNIVWSGFENKNYEVFFYNGERIKKITNNKFDDIEPQISGLNIVWSGQQSLNDTEIFLATPDRESQTSSMRIVVMVVFGVMLFVNKNRF